MSYCILLIDDHLCIKLSGENVIQYFLERGFQGFFHVNISQLNFEPKHGIFYS